MFAMYEGAFEIQTCKDNTKCSVYQLDFADKIYYPADGFQLVLKDYDGDGDKDDFSLGQGQTPDPRFGNFMYYQFFTVNTDGSIMRQMLSTKDGKSLVTIPGDYSKNFKCKNGSIRYDALTEDGTKTQTVNIVPPNINTRQ